MRDKAKGSWRHLETLRILNMFQDTSRYHKLPVSCDQVISSVQDIAGDTDAK